jgi:WD40 repeat protein
MSRAGKALDDGDMRTLFELLERHIPQEGETDYRGFEWHYLARLVGSSHSTLLELDSALYYLCASPDQQLIAAMGKDAVVRFFRPNGGRVEPDIMTGQIEVNGGAFSPDGPELATAGDDGTICIWDIATRERLRTFRGHPGKAFQVAYSPDGDVLVVCGDDPVVRSFDARTGREMQKLSGHERTVQALAINGGGGILATASSDGTARVWNRRDGPVTTRNVASAMSALALSQDGKLLVTASENGLVQTWSTAEGRELSGIGHRDAASSVALSPSGDALAIGDGRGSIQLRSLDAGGRVAPAATRIWQACRDKVNSLLWLGERDSPRTWRLYAAGQDGRLVSYEVFHKRNRRNIAYDRGETGEHISSLKLLPGGLAMLIASSTGVARRSIVPDSFAFNLPYAPKSDEVLVSGDGRRAVSIATREGEVRFWDVEALLELGKRKFEARIHGASLSGDGKRMALSTRLPADARREEEQLIWLIEVPSGRTLDSVPMSGCSQLAFTPDGRTLAICQNGGVGAWDVSGRRMLWSRVQSRITNLAICHDGRYVATADGNRQVVVRTMQSGAEVHRFLGHLAEVNCVAFSRDGRTLASGSGDGQTKLWHIPTGQHLFDLDRLDCACRGLQFSEDGLYLVSLGSDQIVYYDASADPKFGK